MRLKEATEIMQKDKRCAGRAMDCFEADIACGVCDLFVQETELDEARWTALRLMEGWQKAKEDIRKACGCSTALDIMEKYQKEAEEGET